MNNIVIKKILKSFFLFACIFLSMKSFAVTLSVSVCMKSTGKCGFKTPSDTYTARDDISQIKFTFTGLQFSLDQAYVPTSWGVLLARTNGNPTNNYTCKTTGCADGATATLENNSTTVDPYDSTQVKGSLTIIVNIDSNPFPATLRDMLLDATNNDGLMYVSGLYTKADGTTVIYAANSLAWKADEGAFLNAPTIGVLPRYQGFAVNITPPSDLSSVKQDPVTSPTALIATDNGTVSGYVIAYWPARINGSTSTCNSGWSFVANPISYSTAPTISCIYHFYTEATDGTGGTTKLLSDTATGAGTRTTCTGITGALLTNASTANDDVIIPNFSQGSKQAALAQMIANPTTEYGTTNSCVKVLYIPATQSSWGKQGIKNGDVYGITVWALNSAATTTDPTPNLSLSHSALGFITGVDFGLASLDKDPNLKISTADCFVATAASGNINSDTVFYWRVLRDEYLTKIGFTKFYYKHARDWARYLDEHPKLKPPVNFVLEKSGKFFYYTSLYSKKSFQYIQEKTKSFVNFFLSTFEQKASAEELDSSSEQIKRKYPYPQYKDDRYKNAENNSNESESSTKTIKQYPYPQFKGKSDNNDGSEKKEVDSAPQKKILKQYPYPQFNKGADNSNEKETEESKTPTENTVKQYPYPQFKNASNTNENSDNKTKEADSSTEDLNQYPYPQFKYDVNNIDSMKSRKKGTVDLYFLGGLLFLTKDKNFYNYRYNRRPYAIEIGSNYFFWTEYFGLFIGGKFDYIFAKKEDSGRVLGSVTQAYTRSLYFISLGPVAGIKFKHPKFTYLQPGAFGSIRALRLREEAQSDGDNSNNGNNNNSASGVTQSSYLVEAGGFLDVSIYSFIEHTNSDLNTTDDVILRLQLAYNYNKTKAISSTGYTALVGFAVLLK